MPSFFLMVFCMILGFVTGFVMPSLLKWFQHKFGGNHDVKKSNKTLGKILDTDFLRIDVLIRL